MPHVLLEEGLVLRVCSLLCFLNLLSLSFLLNSLRVVERQFKLRSSALNEGAKLSRPIELIVLRREESLLLVASKLFSLSHQFLVNELRLDSNDRGLITVKVECQSVVEPILVHLLQRNGSEKVEFRYT